MFLWKKMTNVMYVLTSSDIQKAITFPFQMFATQELKINVFWLLSRKCLEFCNKPTAVVGQQKK